MLLSNLRRRLCLYDIALSEEGGGFEVLRIGCVLSSDVPFVQPFRGSYRVVLAPFPCYGGMSESSRGM